VGALKISPKINQIVLVLFLLGALVVSLADRQRARAEGPELLRLEKTLDAMGSSFSIVLYGYDRVRMEAAVDAAMDEAQRLDELLSNYKSESEWSQVNRYAAERPVKVSPELFRLLAECLRYSRESEGAFDITVGPLMKVWGFYKGTGHLPHRPEIAAALAKVGYRHIQLDVANHTVRFDRSGAEMDPGGIGKGYAVDRMVDVLRQNGFGIALVAGSAENGGGGVSEGFVDVHLRQLREIFPGGGQDLRPHHGPAHRVSGAGDIVGFGCHAAHYR
jgi:thiamine biosynthesis lipoprotein